MKVHSPNSIGATELFSNAPNDQIDNGHSRQASPSLQKQHRRDFTNDELKELAKAGVLHLLAKAEADEILAQIDPQEPGEKITPSVFSVRTPMSAAAASLALFAAVSSS